MGEVNELIEENLFNSMTIIEKYCSLILMHDVLKISEGKLLITQE